MTIVCTLSEEHMWCCMLVQAVTVHAHLHTQLTPTPALPPDKMKPVNVAKLAMQASDLYADACTNMMVAGVKEMWDKVGVSCSHSVFVCSQ